MNAAEIKTMLTETAAAIKGSSALLTPQFLATVEALCVQVEARPMLQQTLRVAIGKTAAEIIEAAQDTAKIVESYRKLKSEGTIDKAVATLEALSNNATAIAALDWVL